MTSGPIRQNDNTRSDLAQHADNLDSVLIAVFNAAIRNVERLSPAHSEDTRRICRLCCPVYRRPARTRLALRQVQNCGAPSESLHFEQSATARLFYVVTVGSDSENICNRVFRHGSAIGHTWNRARNAPQPFV